VKTMTLTEAQPHLEQLFDEAQAGSPVLLVRDDQVAKLERVDPPEFGGNVQTLERMLLDAVRGPHADWSPQDLEDIARRVRARRGE
jgi:antitoxin (DNA-binding transcriptional repressor) of toxin-antitoxin stability system